MQASPDTFCPVSRQHWRVWLQENHRTRDSVWLVYHKKKTTVPSILYADAVEEALCFGWIDSTRRSMDEDRFMQFFCKRKPRSGWSKVNKKKVDQLIAGGLMTEAGHESIKTARKNGSWKMLDEVEKGKIPKDLAAALRLVSGAAAYFARLSPSMRKRMLQWLVLARRPETRAKRISEIAELAGRHMKPKQFR